MMGIEPTMDLKIVENKGFEAEDGGWQTMDLDLLQK